MSAHKFPLANKSFGQHFLNSPSVINKITTPRPQGIDAIIEVGPGPGILTSHLAKYGLPFFVIEMDERFLEMLSPWVRKEHIFHQNALDFNWSYFLQHNPFKKIWLVSNLPYNVSVPLTLSFLKTPEISHMTLMYQKEVAQKILPKKNRNTMGSLHALCRSQFDLSHITYAPPGAFIPPPKVESQVLHFQRKISPDVPLDNINEFEDFLRLIFAKKRKQLGGILKAKWGANVTADKLTQCGISLQARAESLSYEILLNLYKNKI